MRIRLLLALLAPLAACRSTPVHEAPPPATGAAAPAPPRLPDAAVATDPALAARCAEYRALLSATEHPPGFPDEAVVLAMDYPARAGSHPIPRQDAEAASNAVRLPVRERLPAALSRSRFVYVDTQRSSTVAELRSLAKLLPRSAELRLLVEKTGEEVVAQHVAMFPRTPPALRAQLPAMRSLDDSALELIRMAGSCTEVLRAFGPLKQAMSLEPLGRLTADALGSCDCRLADLDGYVSLVGYTWLATPRVGYVTVDDKTLAAAKPEATLAELIAALP